KTGTGLEKAVETPFWRNESVERGNQGGCRSEESAADPGAAILRKTLVNNGILLALVAYAVYSWSDAAIKALGSGMTVFEIGFYMTLVSAVCIALTTPKDEKLLN